MSDRSIEVREGEDTIFDIVITDANGPVNITSADLTFKAGTFAETMIELADAAFTRDDAAAGTCHLTIPGTDTEALATFEKLRYDVRKDDVVLGGAEGPFYVKRRLPTTPGP